MKKAPIPWAALPNAEYIDRIVASCATKKLRAKWGPQPYGNWGREADRAAFYACQVNPLRTQCRNAMDGWVSGVTYASEAIGALIAWDDCGALMDMPVDAVKLLAASDHHPAVLLLPAMQVIEEQLKSKT
jgi:hypothetical protein